VLLSNSLSSAASLHAQSLASEGTNTSFEVTVFSKSMTIRKDLAPWPTRPIMVVVGLVRVPPKFLQLWMNLIFFFCCHGDDESDEILIGHVGLVCGSKVCLPAIARRLPTDVWHVYFYFL